MILISILLESAAAGVFLLPLLLVLNKYMIHDAKRTAAYYLFTVYLAAMWSLVGLPNITYIRFDLHVNLIPFADMISDVSSLLNIFLFVPLGCLLPLLWQEFRNGKKAILWGLFTSVSIELLQIFTLRATDINDLITNTLGTSIGWILGVSLRKRIPEPDYAKAGNVLPLLYGCVFAVMFFMQPYLSGFFWNFIY